MKSITLPKIYPITNAELSGLSHAEQVKQMTEAGSTFIQLREKAATSRDLYCEAVEAITVARQSGVALIINDRVDIALAIDADGVHLGQDDLDPVIARQIFGKDKIIGYSTHSLEQVREAMTKPVDYIAFGPIFPTSTKADHNPVVGLQMIRTVKDLIGEMPLVVIGGINRSNILDVLAAGADSAAIISDVFISGQSIGDNLAKIITAAG